VALEVVQLLGEHYSELRERRDLIASVAEQEEVRFRETIVRGLGLLEQAFEAMASRGERVLSGDDAFRLYDTYGFPLDLTQVICAERGFEVDTAGYERALEEARKRSEFKGAEQAVEGVYRAALERVPGGRVEFSGYERDEDSSEVVALIGAGALVERLEAGARGEIVTSKTPFYGEAGGQIGDRGELRFSGGVFVVDDAQKPLDGLVVHRGVVQSGSLAVGTAVSLAVDSARRNATRRNHSATHLLHWALRKVVGPQAQQKGSLVGPDRLRFDFTHGAALSDEQLSAIEDAVNELIVENHTVRTQVLPLDQARTLGAMMIFEEKYGSTVRMLTMGPSTELCGGTHARATGDIGFLKVVGESAVGAGLRRIEAVTGAAAEKYVEEQQKIVAEAAAALRATPHDLGARIVSLLDERKKLERELAEARKQIALGGSGGGGSSSSGGDTRSVNGVKLAARLLPDVPAKELKSMADALKKQLGSGVVALVATADGKASVVVGVTDDLIGKLSAVDLVKAGSAALGGQGGGGRPDMAQAGGPDAANAQNAIAAIEAAIGARIKAA
jgi:alanyl-tRNA synthetase